MMIEGLKMKMNSLLIDLKGKYYSTLHCQKLSRNLHESKDEFISS